MGQNSQDMVEKLKNDTVDDFKDKVTFGPQRRAVSSYFDKVTSGVKDAEGKLEQKVGDWLLPPIQAKDEPAKQDPASKSQIKMSNQGVAPLKQAAPPKDGTKKPVTKRIMTK